MTKSNLKKKVLCSLLAFSAFGVLYNPNAEAAVINGKSVDSTITDEVVFQAGSGKLVIGQDNLNIQTASGVHSIMSKYNAYLKAHPGDKIGALRWAVAPTSSNHGDPNDVPLIGVIGGEGQLDSGLTGLFHNRFEGNFPLLNFLNVKGAIDLAGVGKAEYKNMAAKAGSLINKIDAINTAGEDNKIIGSETERKDVNIIIGSAGGVSPVIVGAVGGDLSVNTGLNGKVTVSGKAKLLAFSEYEAAGSVNAAAKETSVVRNGNIKLAVNNGNLIGGFGGSAAVAMGNTDISYSKKIGNADVKLYKFSDLNLQADLTTKGKTTAAVNGNVEIAVNGGANTACLAGGGLAMGIGGEAVSNVNGNVKIKLDSAADLSNGKFDGITAGITGGGAAVTTFGGKADASAGLVNIEINNGLSTGIVGGGLAAAADATGAAEYILFPDRQLGNDGGYVDANKSQLDKLLKKIIPGDKLDIVINNAVQGGAATSITGDTGISLTGTSSAAGITGGGMAVSSHTYNWKGDGTGSAEDKAEYKVNDSFGYAKAAAGSGKSTIAIDVDSSKMTGKQKSEAVHALKALKNTRNLAAVNKAFAGFQGTGAVVGITGGGLAVAQGSNRSNMEGSSGNWGENGQGAYSEAVNTGAQIDLANGYIVGTFGGGMAIADNNALAAAKTAGDITVNVGNGAEAIGVFGNGFAYFTGTQKTPDGKNADLAGRAEVTAQNSAVNVGVRFKDAAKAGMVTKVDAVLGGGIAVDDSQADKVNAIVTTAGKSEVNVLDGAEVNVMNLGVLKALTGNQQTDPAKALNMGNYLAAVKDAAGNVAIAGGGLAMGGGAVSDVTNAVITIAVGKVTGDILGGGIAVYGHEGKDGAAGGAHVGNAIINLTGGKVDGSVYAGGAASRHDYRSHEYEAARAAVDTAAVNLAGTEVTGIISGAGYYIEADAQNNKVPGGKKFDYSVNSTLNLLGENTLTAVAGASKISGFDTVNFTENSVTVLKPAADGTAGSNTVFIDAAGADGKISKINVAGSARLDVNSLQHNSDRYIIARDYQDNSKLWSSSQLAYDRTAGYLAAEVYKDEHERNVYELVYKDVDNFSAGELEHAVDDAASSLGDFGGRARGIIEGIMTHKEQSSKGAVNMFADMFKDSNQSRVERSLYTSMLIGEDSGVTSNAVAVAQDFAGNASGRLSLTQNIADKEVDGNGGVWAKYIHNKHDLNRMNSSFGALSSSSSYNGVMVGADFAGQGRMQGGIAFAYADGDGKGLATKNNFDMWGISLYGNLKNADSNLIGDIGFSKSSNNLTGKVLDSEFNTDRDLNILTMGVRAEKLYTHGATQIVPYAGLRYMNVRADSYTTAYKSGNAFSYDADHQNIWTLPVGVSLRNETVAGNGWRIAPKLDLAYIWAFGDTDNNMTVNAGSGASVLSYDVMDSGSWLTSVGIDAGKGDWSYGVSYTFQKGSHAENSKWFANINYSF